MEDTILLRAATVVDGLLAWAEVESTQEQPPAEWVEQLGEAQARQRFRLAKAAWLSQSEAPIGAKLANNVMIGIAKARGQQSKLRSGNQLNVQICLPAPTSKEHPEAGQTIEVIDVDP